MATKTIVTHFQRMISNLIGRELSQVFCGPSTGTVLSIGFAPLVLRPIPLANQKITVIEREYHGAFRLYIECAWRLTNRKVVIAASGMSDNDITYLSALKSALCGKQVIAISRPEQPTFDLTIELSDELTFSIFCDIVGDDDYVANYTFFLPDETLIVGSRGIRRER